MPTNKPRITVTLEPQAYEVLSRLSALGGGSMSAQLSQLLSLSLPSLERVVVVLERAVAAPQEAHAGLLAAVERAERVLLPSLMSSLAMSDMFMDDISETVAPPVKAPARPKVARASSAAASRSKDPRLVTRGSGGVHKGAKGGGRG